MGLNNFTVADLARSLRTIPLFRDVSPRAMLGTVDFFSDLPAEALDELSREATIREYPAGAIVAGRKFTRCSTSSWRARRARSYPPRRNCAWSSTAWRGGFFRRGAGLLAGAARELHHSADRSRDPRASGSALKSLISSPNRSFLMDRRNIERSLGGPKEHSLFSGLSAALFEVLLEGHSSSP
jgi:hypothetical protein